MQRKSHTDLIGLPDGLRQRGATTGQWIRVASPAMVEIRRAEPKDADMLAQLGADTFVEMCMTVAPEIEPVAKAHVEEAFTAKGMRRDLRDPNVVALVMEVMELPGGYALLDARSAPAPVQELADRPMGLARIYLVRELQGQGLGDSLLARAEDEARGHGADALWLGAWELNKRSLSFYERRGYRVIGRIPWHCGDYRDEDLLFFKPL